MSYHKCLQVCEIISVDEYKHAYAFGEFETTKALMLRIGRNQRLWRMNVISNHRFTDTELEEWQSIMRAERQKIPSASEIDKRKAQMRKAVFGPNTEILDQYPTEVSDFHDQDLDVHWSTSSESMATYSEADVARIVNARRKRNESARFRERQTGTVARLNHGQTRTRYEHEVNNARDAYITLLIAHSKNLNITPELAAVIQKVEQTETWLRVDNDGFERDVDELASKLFEARRKQLPNHASGETEDCRRARKLHRENRQKLIDFRKNALDLRKKRDTDTPSRTSMLHAINEAKKHENALADMAYGEKKIIDEHDRDCDADHSIFQRRATKPTMLWTTTKTQSIASTLTQEHVSSIVPRHDVRSTLHEEVKTSQKSLAAAVTVDKTHTIYQQSQRQRNGMSLREYLTKARAVTK